MKKPKRQQMYRVVMAGRPPGFFVTREAAEAFARNNNGEVQEHNVGDCV